MAKIKIQTNSHKGLPLILIDSKGNEIKPVITEDIFKSLIKIALDILQAHL